MCVRKDNCWCISKKAQHEIVGFVLIVVVVVIVGIIFLALSLRTRGMEIQESIEAGNFLDAALGLTTDCALNYVPNYVTLEELIRACNNGKTCVDGKKACEVMNSTFLHLLERSWKITEDSYVKGYRLRIYANRTSILEDITVLAKGNCTMGRSLGAMRMIPSRDEDIVVEFRICYSTTSVQ